MNWKPYLDTAYEVSDDGRIRNSTTKKELSPQSTIAGYKRVTMTIGGRKKTAYVHRLVMAVHKPLEFDDTLTVDHIDRDPANNRSSNLRMATMRDQRKNTKRKRSKGVGVYGITQEGVMTLYESTRHAARELGVAQSGIVRAAGGKYATCGERFWVYAHALNPAEDLRGESWKEIGPKVHVSNMGRVKKIVGSSPLVKASTDLCRTDGYPRIRVKGKAERLHRLVAKEFVPRTNEAHTQVNHINGDKMDATAANLEWTSPSDNAHHTHWVRSMSAVGRS